MIDFKNILPRATANVDRERFIIERCAGKTVLHLGCVDSGLTAEKLASGGLLHQRLTQVAARVIGVDLDGAGLAAMRRYGVSDLHELDVCRIGELDTDARIDVIVAGELIEHVGNVEGFLNGAHALMRRHSAEMIITTPNAHSWRSFTSVLLGVEEVHPDHNVYFSVTTLRNLLAQKCGFQVIEIAVYSLERARLNTVARYYRGRLRPRSPTGSADAAVREQLPTQAIDERTLNTGVGLRLKNHMAFIGTAAANSVFLAVTPFSADGLIFVVRC